MAHRSNRFVRAGAATTVALTLGFDPPVATAEPSPPSSSSSESLQRYKKLGTKAAKANEELLAAQQDLQRKRNELAAADDASARARAAEEARAVQVKARGRVDRFIKAPYKGARLNTVSALLVSEPPGRFWIGEPCS
ncbi:hypothetical protein FHX42_001438 [Saccharopolyspora lacisalsi]|uniref:Uncharacterized protein n=1 Tax=Halosaccharopolyspora lacisalsi TaxID=1000566 RepID=A0A839DTM5_9PSEU|nr:hypothetical protein [Halosaccharopolyspora lacisalsi]MBA8824109.1 hypothetical protein [Halosaccharopolyspora lacisalsi]